MNSEKILILLVIFLSNLYSNYSKIYVAIIINQTHNDQNGANLGACFDIALYALLMYSVLCECTLDFESVLKSLLLYSRFSIVLWALLLYFTLGFTIFVNVLQG